MMAMISIDELAKLMAGDEDDRRAAGLLIQAESFARGAISALIELADSGYEDAAGRLAQAAEGHLRAI